MVGRGRVERFKRVCMHCFAIRHSDQVTCKDKILDVPKMWQNERLQLKNDRWCCRMITNTLDMIIGLSIDIQKAYHDILIFLHCIVIRIDAYHLSFKFFYRVI
jgi:hypothetical protein